MNQAGATVEPQPEIPEKLYFRIGEVSRLVGVKPYVLRYWESEFPSLAPQKSGSGHRFYRRKDVELLLRIKQLLYEKRFTIEGARQYLEALPKPAKSAHQGRAPKAEQPTLFSSDPAGLEGIRAELASILELLK
jgi:DNA-binding transcriptional MerR regulator